MIEMTATKRIRYIIRMREPFGREFIRSQVISDTGNEADNNDFIKNNLKDELKSSKILSIENVEKGPFLKISKEKLKEDVMKAIKNTEKITVGFASKLSKKMRNELGVDIVKKLDDSNFHKYLILYYCHDGRSYRVIESEKLGVSSPHYHGGHIYSNFLNKHYNIYEEHKTCLDDDDVDNILKKMKILNIKRTHIIKTSIDIYDLNKDFFGYNPNQKQKNIDDWIN